MKNITKGYEIIVWKIERHEIYADMHSYRLTVFFLIFIRDATRMDKKNYTSADDALNAQVALSIIKTFYRVRWYKNLYTKYDMIK